MNDLMKWAPALLLVLTSSSWAANGTYRGTFAWGHEVEAFQPCGSKKAYWVKGEKKTLQPLRDRTESLRKQRGKPYQPVYIEAIGAIDTKTKREGFAEGYDGIFHLDRVTRVSSVLPKGCGK